MVNSKSALFLSVFLIAMAMLSGIGMAATTYTPTYVYNIEANITVTGANNTWIAMNRTIDSVVEVGNVTGGMLGVGNYTYNSTAFKFMWTAKYAGAQNVTIYRKATIAQTTQFLYTYLYPINNSVFPNKSTEMLSASQGGFLNVTNNASYTDCEFMVNSHNATYYPLVATQTGNNTWNSSADDSTNVLDALNSEGWYTIIYKCWVYSGTHKTNITYTNSSVFRYKYYSGSFDMTRVSGYTNNTYYSTNTYGTPAPLLNITLVSSFQPASCTLIQNVSTEYPMLNSSVPNVTAANTIFFTNGSRILLPELTAYNTPVAQNFTWYCQDAWGNKTFLNVSNSKSKYLYVFQDSLNPVVKSEIFKGPTNYTTGGHNISVVYTALDNSTLKSCYVTATYQTGYVYNFTTSAISTGTDGQHNCTVQIRPADIKRDGAYTLAGSALDSASNRASGTTTQTFVIYRLTAGWNLISTPFNYTLGQIGGLAKNITYVSVFDNTFGMKNYTTYTIGTSTNANVKLNQTNATYIYVVENRTLMMNFSGGHLDITTGYYNASLWANSSATAKPGWNQVGIYNYSISANKTLWNIGGCVNMTSGGVEDPFAGSNCQNVTYLSIYMPQLGKYCTASRSKLTTSCYPQYTSTNLTVPFGSGVWLFTVGNVTFNRVIAGD